MDQTQPFYVGLCMAGAVSAGAYTAGVMDYLIQALDDWEKQRGQEGVPTHLVKIPVIGGASAGGMTGIITASAINNPIPPVTSINPTQLLQQQPQNKFYHSWVDLLEDDMFPRMLGTDDISKGKILSLLNSSFIEDIANRALQVDKTAWLSRPYFADRLKVFTTLTSLRGLSFDISFRAAGKNPDPYYVTRHNDYACFELNTSEAEYEGKGWIPLNFRTDLSAGLARDAAMATGAFPVGLSSRKVIRNSKYVNDNVWLRALPQIKPFEDPQFETMVVDGGMINNEPFEKVREVLINVTGQDNPGLYHDYNTFTSTVLMIDPFPSLQPTYKTKDELLPVMGGTLSALIDQVRIKPEALIDAMNSNHSGQYLIAPTRDVPQWKSGGMLKAEIGAKAIACGAFEGFSGFFSKEFRIHDYFLGRANCEKFLRDHFTVPADSTNLITAGYASVSEDAKRKLYSQTDSRPGLPIIPVLVERKPKYMPVFSSRTDWPLLEDKDIERFRGKMKDRADSLIMNMAEYGLYARLALKIGSFVVLKHKLAGVVMDAIKKTLKDHQLLN